MSWYSTGAEAAEKMAASMQTRRTKNFFTKPGESARIRFLSPATKSFNYKRAFVPWAKGQKLLTSPGTTPDPFIERGLQLQAAFAWPIIDRRKFEFEDKETGETKEVGPRVLFFADGQRTRKQLIGFEKEMLANVNEERQEEGQDPLTLDEFNLSSYDIKASKEKGAPWTFVAMKPKELSDKDKELYDKADFKLEAELAPLDIADLKAILARPTDEETTSNNGSEYSYSDEDEDVVSFSK